MPRSAKGVVRSWRRANGAPGRWARLAAAADAAAIAAPQRDGDSGRAYSCLVSATRAAGQEGSARSRVLVRTGRLRHGASRDERPRALQIGVSARASRPRSSGKDAPRVVRLRSQAARVRLPGRRGRPATAPAPEKKFLIRAGSIRSTSVPRRDQANPLRGRRWRQITSLLHLGHGDPGCRQLRKVAPTAVVWSGGIILRRDCHDPDGRGPPRPSPSIWGPVRGPVRSYQSRRGDAAARTGWLGKEGSGGAWGSALVPRRIPLAPKRAVAQHETGDRAPPRSNMQGRPMPARTKSSTPILWPPSVAAALDPAEPNCDRGH